MEERDRDEGESEGMERRLVEKGGMIRMCAGLHLEIDPRGGRNEYYENKKGGWSPVYIISTCTLGESGGMLPQKILDFRLFWCILRDFVLNREFLIWEQM